MRQAPFALALLLCATAPLRLCAQDTTAISRALTAGYAQFSRAYAGRWPDTVAAVYAEDAIYLAPGQDVIRGRAAIRATFASFLNGQTGPGPVVTFDIIDRRYSRDLVHEQGYYRMGPAGSDLATLQRVGKFTVAWGRQRDGSWKIISDNYSFLTQPTQQAAAPAAVVTPDSILRKRDSFYRVALASISGRENEPAGTVFKNIKVFTQMPAGRLLIAMRDGFSPSLGVDCTHCHVAGDFASEENDRKQIARDMMAMDRRITTELLPAVPNLRSQQPQVTCSTCHRGQVKPATVMR
jgi:uncharacterized protein (TIGR02246 family)